MHFANKNKAIICISAILLAFAFLISGVRAADPTVYVEGNGQFIAAGFTGSGTVSDPYILQDKVISAASAHGIFINNTDAYFIVRNCTVYDGGSSYYGIWLKNVKNGRIENCTAYNSNSGIHLGSSSNSNTIINNTCYNNGYGITLTSSNGNTLTDNKCYNNTNYGIYLMYSSNSNTLINNTCYNNKYDGIILTSSNGNTLTDNKCYNNTNYGIYLVSSSNSNTLINNTCYNNKYGIYLVKSSNFNTFTDNYVHNYVWDFYSDSLSVDNVVQNLHIYCYPTTISFTYGDGIQIVGVPEGSIQTYPSNLLSLSMYVNVTNVTSTSWIFLNVSYSDSDIAGIDESSLVLYRWNGSSWVLADGSGIRGVDTVNNYVYAKITEFSIFGAFGAPTPVGGFVIPNGLSYTLTLMLLILVIAACTAALFRRIIP